MLKSCTHPGLYFPICIKHFPLFIETLSLCPSYQPILTPCEHKMARYDEQPFSVTEICIVGTPQGSNPSLRGIQIFTFAGRVDSISNRKMFHEKINNLLCVS